MQLPFAVRSLGQQLFRNVPVRIASGINQGAKWSIASTGRGYGSGTFGADRLEALAHLARPGDCFWDIGAHKGFVTLAAAQMVGRSGTVVTVEPSALNRWFIERHLSWNHLDRVTVVPWALAGERTEARFGGRGDSLAYTLGQGDETVPVRTIRDVIADFGVPRPDVVKIDAEGQEAAILRGAGEALGGDAALMISVHGREMHGACTGELTGRGFKIFESWEMAQCSADPNRAWTSDYDLVAVGPEREIDEDRLRSASLFTHD